MAVLKLAMNLCACSNRYVALHNFVDLRLGKCQLCTMAA